MIRIQSETRIKFLIHLLCCGIACSQSLQGLILHLYNPICASCTLAPCTSLGHPNPRGHLGYWFDLLKLTMEMWMWIILSTLSFGSFDVFQICFSHACHGHAPLIPCTRSEKSVIVGLVWPCLLLSLTLSI